MGITLNDQRLFGTGRATLTVEPWQHGTQRHAVAGLDGIVNVDLGRRGRVIRQVGTLHADNERVLRERIRRIEALGDGVDCVLRTDDGACYANLSMDRFAVTSAVRHGAQVRCEYEMTYTQRCE